MKTKALHDGDLEQISGGMTSKEKREYYTAYGGFGCDLKFGVCWVYN